MALDGFCLGTAAFCHQDRALGQLLMFLKFIVGGDRLPRAAGLFLTRLLRDACLQATERGFSAPRPCRAPSGRRRRPGPAPRGGRAAARPCGALCRRGGERAPRPRLPLTARAERPPPACGLAWSFPPSWWQLRCCGPPSVLRARGPGLPVPQSPRVFR